MMCTSLADSILTTSGDSGVNGGYLKLKMKLFLSSDIAVATDSIDDCPATKKSPLAISPSKVIFKPTG